MATKKRTSRQTKKKPENSKRAYVSEKRVQEVHDTFLALGIRDGAYCQKKQVKKKWLRVDTPFKKLSVLKPTPGGLRVTKNSDD